MATRACPLFKVDVNKGNSADVEGNNVDVKGNNMDVKDKSVDVKCNSVDVKGNSVNVKGKIVWMLIKGNIVDVKGNSVEVEVECILALIATGGPSNRVDVEGNRVDVEGNRVDVEGNHVNVKGNSVAVKGNSAAVKGNNVDVKGTSADGKGNSVDDKGNSADVKGNNVAVKSNCADGKGKSVDAPIRYYSYSSDGSGTRRTSFAQYGALCDLGLCDEAVRVVRVSVGCKGCFRVSSHAHPRPLPLAVGLLVLVELVEEPGHGGHLHRIKLLRYRRINGDAHAARLGVHAEGRLQQMVHVLRHLRVQPGVDVREHNLVLVQTGGTPSAGEYVRGPR
eukprot:5761098-Pyramimonas_sp.AAC.1